MALFPRRIAGRYAALSRWDRESNAIAYSDDASRLVAGRQLQSPVRPWELIQLGNCGSPIETPAGWLVFTHGVGPMREYAIGAVLLDLDEPERLIGRAARAAAGGRRRPSAKATSRTSSTPAARWSHGDDLVLPYGCSDSSVRIATIDLPRLLERLGQG